MNTVKARLFLFVLWVSLAALCISKAYDGYVSMSKTFDDVNRQIMEYHETLNGNF